MLDIGVVRIDKIEREQFKLVDNDYQIVITPPDYCDKIPDAEPFVQSLLKNVMPFDTLIPHIQSDLQVGKLTLLLIY